MNPLRFRVAISESNSRGSSAIGAHAAAAEHVAVLLAEDAAAEPLAAVLGRQRRLERLPHSSRPAEPRAAGAGL